MIAYNLTPLAKADIFQIWTYIAENSEDAANRVEQAIYEACLFVGGSPLRGHVAQGVANRTLRFWTLTRYPNYIVVYRPQTRPVEIIAIVHGKRNIKRVLEQRPS